MLLALLLMSFLGFLLGKSDQFLRKGLLIQILSVLIDHIEELLKCFESLRTFKRVGKVPFEHLKAGFWFLIRDDRRQLVE